tara:strand:- start:281 stop:457 length:177 start_codon:yes stop_codon:yes gene_type:complete
MKQDKKTVNVVSTNRKKHSFELETTTMSGYTFCYLKKNGNIILNCSPKEMIKLKKLFG